MAAHRAWRLKYDSTLNPGRNCCNASRVEFRATLQGADLTQGATGNAFANDSTYGAASNAFDNNDGSIWHDGCGSGGASWIGWDWGATAGNWVDINTMLYRARNDGYAAQDSPATGGLEWTDDDPTSGGATWTRLFSIVDGSTYDSGEQRVFTAPPATDLTGHKAWRVRDLDAESGYNGWQHIQFNKTYGVDTPLSGFGKTFRSTPNFQAGNQRTIFFPVDAITGYCQWENGASNFVGMDYQDVRVAPASIKLYDIVDGSNRGWENFAVEWSDDGQSTWTLSDEFHGVTWSHAAQEFHLSGGAPVVIRRRAIIIL